MKVFYKKNDLKPSPDFIYLFAKFSFSFTFQTLEHWSPCCCYQPIFTTNNPYSIDHLTFYSSS